MSNNKNKSHFLEYLSLSAILIVGFGSFLYFSFDRQTQMLIGFATAVSYFIWGLTHHYAEGNLNWKIVVEYALIAAISAILILSLVLRS